MSAGRTSRSDYECGRMRRVQEEYQDQTMNEEACEECSNNFQDQTMNVEACKDSYKARNSNKDRENTLTKLQLYTIT